MTDAGQDSRYPVMNEARLGYCCKWVCPDGDAAKEPPLNLVGTTVTSLGRMERGPALEKVSGIVGHNIAALQRQIEAVAARPPLERLFRIVSDVLPAYTHPVARWMYDEPALREIVEPGLAGVGETARLGGVRVSLHPGQFCVLATASPSALANALDELEYHAELMRLMGYGGGWHRHGAHINVHGGARAPGVEAFRAALDRLSENARNLVTVENDEVSYGLDDLLPLADRLPIVLDLHHHWIASGGEYIEPDDPRIARVRESWRGVRPLSHISVSRKELIGQAHPIGRRPDFGALIASGVKSRDLRAHSDMMWNEAVNDWVARHLVWTDFEVEAKGKNLASEGLARHIVRRGAFLA